MMTGKFLFNPFDMVAEDVDHNLFETLLFYPHPSYGRQNLIISRRTLSECYIFTTIKGFGIVLLPTMSHRDFLLQGLLESLI